ncbi:unnamed protein product [Lota lota]
MKSSEWQRRAGGTTGPLVHWSSSTGPHPLSRELNEGELLPTESWKRDHHKMFFDTVTGDHLPRSGDATRGAAAHIGSVSSGAVAAINRSDWTTAVMTRGSRADVQSEAIISLP